MDICGSCLEGTLHGLCWPCTGCDAAMTALLQHYTNPPELKQHCEMRKHTLAHPPSRHLGSTCASLHSFLPCTPASGWVAVLMHNGAHSGMSHPSHTASIDWRWHRRMMLARRPGLGTLRAHRGGQCGAPWACTPCPRSASRVPQPCKQSVVLDRLPARSSASKTPRARGRSVVRSARCLSAGPLR